MQTSATVQTIVQGHPTGPVTSYDFTPTGTAGAPLWIFRLGSAVFIGASPELSTDTALDIREGSGFKYAFVASMFEGGAKNMADRWNYALGRVFSRSAGSWAARSAQNARRVCHNGPRPVSWATAFWMISAAKRPGWAMAIRKPTGPP